MRPLLLRGGTVLTLNEAGSVFEGGSVRLEGDRITGVGPAGDVERGGATEIDARGLVLLPGLCNAHTHLYSSLARGLSAGGPAPRTFREILERVWWRWEKLLDPEAVALSARVGLIEAVRSGVTAVNDHHSGPVAIARSLDRIAEAAEAIGVRIATGYEVSDRGGAEIRDAALAENARFARRIAAAPSPRVAATIGAHASFTLSDETLRRLAALAGETRRPVHIHMDEGPEDGEEARREGDRSTVGRLAATGVLREGTIVAHAVHVGRRAIDRLAEMRVFVVHNPLSNGANAVGRAPVPALVAAGVDVCLGTDGMGGGLAGDAAAAGSVHRMVERDRSIPFDLPARLAWGGSARLATALFGATAGVLAPGGAADVVAVRYDPPAPITRESFAAHWQLGILHAPVVHVVVAGRPVLADGALIGAEEKEILARSRETAARLGEAFHERRRS